MHFGISSDISVPKTGTSSSVTVRLCSNGNSGTRRFGFSGRSSNDCIVAGIGSSGTLSIQKTTTNGGSIIRRCTVGKAGTRQ